MATAGRPDRVESYEPFFGLNEAPFSLAPDPRFLFASASHSAALAQVAYALERREPLVVVTGEIGTGKTLLCRTVLQRLQRKTFLSVINDPLLERDDLLKQLLEDFGVISKDRTRLTEASRHELVQALHAFLRSLGAIQAHAVVIIDEAQHLQPDVLEQIRLLSNIDDERGTLLQIILVGQTDLEPLLSRPELRQLQQRVSRRFRLEPLNRDEVQQYIEHRLALARDGKVLSQTPGATELARELAEWAGTNAGVEFTPDAIHAVSQLSGGLPRVINLLCDRSLEEAYASRLRVIDGALIHSAARALDLEPRAAPAIDARSSPSGSFRPPIRTGAAGQDRRFCARGLRCRVGRGRFEGRADARVEDLAVGERARRGGRRVRLVRRSRGPCAGGRAESNSRIAGVTRDSRASAHPARRGTVDRQRAGAANDCRHRNTGAAHSHRSSFRLGYGRNGNRRALRHCGGVLPDRHARGGSGG